MPRSPLSHDPGHALNAICPYFTMFPLEFPLRILRRHRRARVVLNPFCGRGTTLFAARIRGLRGVGIDTSPVAISISQAKLASATTHDTHAAQSAQANAFHCPTSETASCRSTSVFQLLHCPITHDGVPRRTGTQPSLRGMTCSLYQQRAAAVCCVAPPTSAPWTKHSCTEVPAPPAR